jgi:Cytochrome P460
VKVPGGLAFSEFRGYEAWPAISISRNDRVVGVILGNPVMIDAYRAGIPGNGKPVPDGAKMAKVHWNPKQNEFFPDATGRAAC